MKIEFICPDFPVYILGHKIPVTLYSFDTGTDILLGQDFVNKCLPMNVGQSDITLTYNGKTIKVPRKTYYESRIIEKPSEKKLDHSAQSLIKIQKILKHVNLHGSEVIKDIKDKIETDCTSDYPDAFWTREQYFVNLPYREDYLPKPQKASANHMSPSELEYCKAEIQELLKRNLIENSRIPSACPAFYVNKHSEQKRGKPRMVINYRALNAALLPLRFPLPNKELLFSRIGRCNVFTKFDLKSGFWQIGIVPAHRYKTTFVVPQGQYQWRVMPFGLKNAPSEFQKRMEDIFRHLPFVIVYIDDLLVCSTDLRQHVQHLKMVYDLVYKHGLVLSKAKTTWAQTRIEYLGLILSQGTIELQDYVLKKILEFPDEILDMKQLQRFLGCLNYIRQFYENQAKDVRILQKRLSKSLPWDYKMTQAVQIIKQKIQHLPTLHIPDSDMKLILETDALDETWAAVLLQKNDPKLEEVCLYTSGCFSEPETKYPSSHKEILAVKNGIKKYRMFLKPVDFIVRTDLKHMKGMLANHRLLEQGNNRVLRWSLWLEGYDFDIEYKPGKENCLADLLTREASPKN